MKPSREAKKSLPKHAAKFLCNLEEACQARTPFLVSAASGNSHRLPKPAESGNIHNAISVYEAYVTYLTCTKRKSTSIICASTRKGFLQAEESCDSETMR